MLKHRSTNIFSKMSTFYSENDDSNAIIAIMDIARHLKINGKSRYVTLFL